MLSLPYEIVEVLEIDDDVEEEEEEEEADDDETTLLFCFSCII